MGNEERIVRLIRTITTHLHSCMNRCYEDYGMTGIQGLVLMEVANDEECKLGGIGTALANDEFKSIRHYQTNGRAWLDTQMPFTSG